MMCLRSIVLFASLLSFWAVDAYAAPPVVLSKQACTFVGTLPYVITTPGHYCMDVGKTTQSQGILIEASDVLLDCKGNGIGENFHATDTVGISATGGLHNVTIQNCQLLNFGVGINVGAYRGQNLTLSNNHVDNSISVGIQAGGNELRLIGNHVTNTYNVSGQYSIGIQVLPFESGIAATGQVLLNNLVAETVSDTGAIGISVIGSSAPQILNNQVLAIRGGGSNAWLWLQDDPQGARTSGAKVVNNVAMTKDTTAQGISGGAAVCVGNTTVGFSRAAFDACASGQDNTIIP